MTREEIIVAIEAAEHYLENTLFTGNSEALRGEIAYLNYKLREIDK